MICKPPLNRWPKRSRQFTGKLQKVELTKKITTTAPALPSHYRQWQIRRWSSRWTSRVHNLFLKKAAKQKHTCPIKLYLFYTLTYIKFMQTILLYFVTTDSSEGTFREVEVRWLQISNHSFLKRVSDRWCYFIINLKS